MILASTLSFVLGSLRGISPGLAQALSVIDTVTVAVFTVEFALRAWAAPESRRLTHYKQLRPLAAEERQMVKEAVLADDDARIRAIAAGRIVRTVRSDWVARCVWLLRPAALIDLAAIVPTYVELAVAAAGGGLELPTLTFLRLLRLFRLLKTERYVLAFDAVVKAVWTNRDILVAGAIVCAILLTVTSAALWFTVTDGGVHTAPAGLEALDSIPDAMYATILLLTGQGVPGGPLPDSTRVVVGLTALLSIPVFSVPASMLAWSFEGIAESLQRQRAKLRRKRWRALLQGYVDSTTSSSSSSSGGGDGDDPLSVAGDSLLEVTSTDSDLGGEGADDGEVVEGEERGAVVGGRRRAPEAAAAAIGSCGSGRARGDARAVRRQGGRWWRRRQEGRGRGAEWGPAWLRPLLDRRVGAAEVACAGGGVDRPGVASEWCLSVLHVVIVEAGAEERLAEVAAALGTYVRASAARPRAAPGQVGALVVVSSGARALEALLEAEFESAVLLAVAHCHEGRIGEALATAVLGLTAAVADGRVRPGSTRVTAVAVQSGRGEASDAAWNVRDAARTLGVGASAEALLV